MTHMIIDAIEAIGDAIPIWNKVIPLNLLITKVNGILKIKVASKLWSIVKTVYPHHLNNHYNKR